MIFSGFFLEFRPKARRQGKDNPENIPRFKAADL
jgi:hypothetical protein